MKIFHCEACGSLVFFENVKCLQCGHVLGFLPKPGVLSALEPGKNGAWQPLATSQTDKLFRACENARQHEVCNWLVPVEDANPFCASCRLNQMIPNLSIPANLELWHKFENAKRRVIYTILSLGLPVEGVLSENRPALRFKFLSDEGGGPVMTGHAGGEITFALAEADDVERERRRVNLHEPYRTLLGHMRHEIAHYFWDRLIAGSPWITGFRQLFGDETADYGAALKRHYKEGPPPDWPSKFVSAYATAHPWEDWAETTAHYFHIMDMVETAGSFGLTLQPRHPAAKIMTAAPLNVLEASASFEAILESWFPLTYALNSINRGMGLPDVYPFALADGPIQKLKFVHQVMQSSRAQG